MVDTLLATTSSHRQRITPCLATSHSSAEAAGVPLPLTFYPISYPTLDFLLLHNYLHPSLLSSLPWHSVTRLLTSAPPPSLCTRDQYDDVPRSSRINSRSYPHSMAMALAPLPCTTLSPSRRPPLPLPRRNRPPRRATVTAAAIGLLRPTILCPSPNSRIYSIV